MSCAGRVRQWLGPSQATNVSESDFTASRYWECHSESGAGSSDGGPDRWLSIVETIEFLLVEE